MINALFCPIKGFSKSTSFIVTPLWSDLCIINLFLTLRIILDKLFINNSTYTWIGLKRINKTWAWSDGVVWSDENPQLETMENVFDTMQGSLVKAAKLKLASQKTESLLYINCVGNKLSEPLRSY